MRELWKVLDRPPRYDFVAWLSGAGGCAGCLSRLVDDKGPSSGRTTRIACLCGRILRGGKEGGTRRLCAGRRIKGMWQARDTTMDIGWGFNSTAVAHSAAASDTLRGWDMSFNWSIDADPHQQEAPSRRLLWSGSLSTLCR